MVWTIYHNPRCSKSRESLALLQANGIEPTVHLYLENPPDSEELRQLVRQLRLPARALLRDNEPEYDTLDLANPQLSDDKIIAAIARHPRLLQRPIISDGQRAVIGRPPENLLQLL